MLGSILSAGAAKDASRSAQAAQTQGYQTATGNEQSAYNTISGNFSPYLAAGQGAVGAYGNLLGINGAPNQQAAITSLQASPYYQSLYNTGRESLLQNASATGGLRGGNTESGLYQLGSNTLAQTIQNQLTNLQGATSMGLSATGALSGYGAETANMLASLATGQGNATAQDILQRGNLTAGMWNSLGSGLDSMAQKIPGIGSFLGSIL
jgi:hypothetical protein